MQGNLNLQNHNLNNVNTLNVGSIGATSSPVLFNNDISLANYSANNVLSLNITNGGTINNAKLIKVKGTGSGTNAAQINLFTSTNSTTTANFDIVVDDTYTSTSLNSSSNMNFNSGGEINFSGGDINLSGGGSVNVNKTLNLANNSIENVESLTSVGGALGGFQIININGIGSGDDAAQLKLFSSSADPTVPNFTIVVDDTYGSCAINSLASTYFNSGADLGFGAYGNVFFNPNGGTTFNGNGDVNISPAGGNINLNTPTDTQIGLNAQAGIVLTAYDGSITFNATPNIYGTANTNVIFIAGENLNLSGQTANISTTDGTLDISANGDLTMEAVGAMTLTSNGEDLVLNAPSHNISFETSINVNSNTINNIGTFNGSGIVINSADTITLTSVNALSIQFSAHESKDFASLDNFFLAIS